jgi:DNA-binding transcriptional LysR family regulator
MIELQDLAIFVKTVELENLTRTAEALGLPKSTVSRRLTRLEAHLGVQLLRRSTHSVTVTEQGGVFFEHSLRCLGVLRDGERAVQTRHLKPQGLIRVAVPAALDRALFGPLVAGFLANHPDVRIVSVLTNEKIDVLRDGYDLAIVSGALPQAESSLTATKVGSTQHGLFASPAYVEARGMPQTHVDLPRYDLLATGALDGRGQWRLEGRHDAVQVDFRPRLTCNDLMLLREAVLSGFGIAALPAFVAKHDLATGRLVEVLPDRRFPDEGFYAVFPRHQVMPVRLRAFIDHLVERLRPALTWDPSPRP